MHSNIIASKSLVAIGLLLFAIGQYCSWFTLGDGAESRNLQGNLEDSQFIRLPVGNEIFSIEAAEFRPHPNGHVLIRVLLANRLSQSVTILGGTKGCAEAGCWLVVLDRPLAIAPKQLQWMEFDVKWNKAPVKPLSIVLFTSISLTTRIELQLSPLSVTCGRQTLPIVPHVAVGG